MANGSVVNGGCGFDDYSIEYQLKICAFVFKQFCFVPVEFPYHMAYTVLSVHQLLLLCSCNVLFVG